MWHDARGGGGGAEVRDGLEAVVLEKSWRGEKAVYGPLYTVSKRALIISK